MKAGKTVDQLVGDLFDKAMRLEPDALVREKIYREAGLQLIEMSVVMKCEREEDEWQD